MGNNKIVWDFLRGKLKNDFGVAGIIGNLYAESGIRANNLQNSYEKSLGMTDEEYTAAVDSGDYSMDAFTHDGAGYGIAQWTYWSRKRELYLYCKHQEKSIGDLQSQLEFLWMELSGYSAVINALNTATSVRAASDAVLLGFERPADQSEHNCIVRAGYGEKIYELFHGEQPGRTLTIYKRYFYQSDCYNSGYEITPSGVQVHSTGANNPWLKRYVQPDDGRLGVNPNGNDHNRGGITVCASAYIGKQEDGTVAVYQALPWDHRCWLSGSGNNGNANRLGYIGFEICEDGKRDRAYFDDAVMDQAVLLTAYLCQQYGIPVDSVRDHSELHGMGLASNHADISHWLKRFGLTMDDFREAVNDVLADGIVETTYIDCDEVSGMYDAITVNPGSYLNLRSGPGQNYAAIARIPKGSIVMVIDDSNPQWWQVSYQGQQGFAMAQYLQKLDDPDTPEEPEDKPEGNPVLPEKIEIPLALAMQLYNVLGEQLCIDARSGNISNIDYQ